MVEVTRRYDENGEELFATRDEAIAACILESIEDNDEREIFAHNETLPAGQHVLESLSCPCKPVKVWPPDPA